MDVAQHEELLKVIEAEITEQKTKPRCFISNDL